MYKIHQCLLYKSTAIIFMTAEDIHLGRGNSTSLSVKHYALVKVSRLLADGTKTQQYLSVWGLCVEQYIQQRKQTQKELWPLSTGEGRVFLN